MPENSQLEPHPIFDAIYSGNLEEVKNIIEKDRLSLEQVDENQDTPIFAAIYSENSDNLDIVKEILKLDSSVLGQVDENQDTPIFAVIRTIQPEIVKVIIEKDPFLTLNQKNLDNDTPIFLAALISCSSAFHDKAIKSESLKIILEHEFPGDITESAKKILKNYF